MPLTLPQQEGPAQRLPHGRVTVHGTVVPFRQVIGRAQILCQNLGHLPERGAPFRREPCGRSRIQSELKSSVRPVRAAMAILREAPQKKRRHRRFKQRASHELRVVCLLEVSRTKSLQRSSPRLTGSKRLVFESLTRFQKKFILPRAGNAIMLLSSQIFTINTHQIPTCQNQVRGALCFSDGARAAPRAHLA